MVHIHSKAKSGNILFLILLGVFLFGALTYSFTKTSRTGGATANLTEDKAELYASELLQYASAIREGIGRMEMLHGVNEYSINVISYANDTVSGSSNTTCTSNKCRLFHPEGGAIKPHKPPLYFYDPQGNGYGGNYTSRYYFRTAPVPGIGSDKSELLLVLLGVDAQICKAINLKMANIPTSTILPDQGWTTWGNYATILSVFPEGTNGPSSSLFTSKKAFCVGHNAYKQIFVYVLLER